MTDDHSLIAIGITLKSRRQMWLRDPPRKESNTVQLATNTKKKSREKTNASRGFPFVFTSAANSTMDTEGLEDTDCGPDEIVKSKIGGTQGGTLAPNSDRLASVFAQLREHGFTPEQLVQISAAIREAGLEFVEAKLAGRGTTNAGH